MVKMTYQNCYNKHAFYNKHCNQSIKKYAHTGMANHRGSRINPGEDTGAPEPHQTLVGGANTMLIGKPEKYMMEWNIYSCPHIFHL